MANRLKRSMMTDVHPNFDVNPIDREVPLGLPSNKADEDLRRWAVEQAVRVVADVDQAINLADKFYKYVTDGEVLAALPDARAQLSGDRHV